MKTIVKKMSLILICLMITLVSCNDDYPNDGFLKVDGQSYALNDASLETVGYDNGYYQLRLTLDNTNANTAHSFNVLLFAEVNDYLPTASYTPYLYDNDFHNKFKRAAWSVGGVEVGVVMKGKVKSTKNNDIYTIHVDCEDINGKDIVAEYKGEIKVKK